MPFIHWGLGSKAFTRTSLQAQYKTEHGNLSWVYVSFKDTQASSRHQTSCNPYEARTRISRKKF